jgi:hypothetical protein
VRIDPLSNESNAGAKLFGLAGGDPGHERPPHLPCFL